MLIVTTLALFIVTAVAEIIGCYLPFLWLRKSGPVWLIPIAAASLALFSWLLTLHPTASGRIYAAYGGVYVAVALVWLWRVERERVTAWDMTGAGIMLLGSLVIVVGGWKR